MRSEVASVLVSMWASMWALGAAMLLSPSSAQASVSTSGCGAPSSCTLSELFAGGSLTVGTRQFSNWELHSIDPDGVMPDFSQVVVTGLDDGGLDPGSGIRFSGNGELAVSDENRLDLEIIFRVTDLQPTIRMGGSELTISSDTVAGSARLAISGFVANGNGIAQGGLDVETDPSFATSIPVDAIGFRTSQAGLIVLEEILIESSVAGDSAELDAFEQRFTQLPEPNVATGLVAGVVAVSALGMRRRASQRAARRVRRVRDPTGERNTYRWDIR